MCRDADTFNHTNHSDLGSENWVITLNESMGYNYSIITSAKVEGAECLSNHNTYTDWSQLEYEAVSHQGWSVDHNTSNCGNRRLRDSVAGSMAYGRSSIRTHISLDYISKLEYLQNN